MGLKRPSAKNTNSQWVGYVVPAIGLVLVLAVIAIAIRHDIEADRPVSKVFTVCGHQASPATGSPTYDLVVADREARTFRLHLESNPVTAAEIPGLVTGGTYMFTFPARDEQWRSNARVTSITLLADEQQRPQDCGLPLRR